MTAPRVIAEKRYFTGKPCRYGHVAERWVSTGICVECDRLRPRSEKDIARDRAHQRRKNAENPFPNRIRAAAWAKANPERVKARKRYPLTAKIWREKNREKLRASWRAKYRKHKEKHKVYSRLRKARKKGAAGRYQAKDVIAILRAQRSKCAYCRKKLNGHYHVDHIIAVVNGGTNFPSNLQITCATCNCKKRDLDPIDFAQQNGLLL